MEKSADNSLHGDVLITDASMDPQLKCGVGGYLFLPAASMDAGHDAIDITTVMENLVVRRFTNTGSTQLEIQTALWALGEYRDTLRISGHGELSLYTDSQCVAGLLRRRPGLEKKEYISGKKKGEMKNASLYRRFYALHDELGFRIVRVAGHSPSSSHDMLQRLFSRVDREARKALRRWMDELKGGR
jgi:ribonuclease HI